MPRLSDLMPSPFLKAKDVPREGLTLTIDRVERGQMMDVRTQKPKVVHTAYWKEPGVKPLTLNHVNINTLIMWYGDIDVAEMVGKTVHLIRVYGESFGKAGWMVRIEPPEEPDEEESEERAAPPADEIPF